MANSSSRKITEVCFVLEPSPIEHLEDSRYQNWLHRESSLSADTPVTSAKKQGFEYWTTAAAAFPDVGLLAKYFDQLIEPAVDGNGFRIVRSSQISTSHFVTRQHLQLARDAELMIANLSAADPVVYYCVAYRLRCREDLNNDHGTIFVRHTSCKPLLDNLKVQTVPFGFPRRSSRRRRCLCRSMIWNARATAWSTRRGGRLRTAYRIISPSRGHPRLRRNRMRIAHRPSLQSPHHAPSPWMKRNRSASPGNSRANCARNSARISPASCAKSPEGTMDRQAHPAGRRPRPAGDAPCKVRKPGA
jgi:hypothetical protein